MSGGGLSVRLFPGQPHRDRWEHRQIGLQLCQDAVGEWHVTGLSPFGQAEDQAVLHWLDLAEDPDEHGLAVDVLHGQAEHFPLPQPPAGPERNRELDARGKC
jgi:hypothetical protein